MQFEAKAVSMLSIILLTTSVLTSVHSRASLIVNDHSALAPIDYSTTDYFVPDSMPPSTEWNKTYGGSSWDVANSVLQMSDGGYMLAGFTQSYGVGPGDAWLVRTNSAGRMLWNRTYGGGDYDEAKVLILASDGGYALAGVTRPYGAETTDFWLVKTDSNGNPQWNRTYGGAGYENLFSAIRTSDNGYALAGYTESYGQGGDFWLVKTDNNGVVIWSRVYGGSGWEEAHSVIQTSDGGYAIVGETDSIGAGGTDVWWVKTDPDGKKQRDQAYGGAYADGANSVVQTSDGGFAITGYTESFGLGMPGFPDFWLVKIESTGRIAWEKTYGGLDADSAESLISTANGGFALAGATLSYGSGDRDFWLVTTDIAGNLNWSQTYGGSGYDYAFSVIETSDGGFALTGDTFSFGAGSADMWLVKTEGSIPIHDVAVIDVTSAKTVVGQGYSLFVNVTVENQGNCLEIMNVTVYADAIIVDTLQAFETLSPGLTTVLSFTWHVTEGEFPKGSYILSVEATIAPPIVDSDPINNSFADGSVFVSFPGDVDADGKVDAFDMYKLGKAYASRHGDLNWNADCDIDNNGIVNTADLVVINENYGNGS